MRVESKAVKNNGKYPTVLWSNLLDAVALLVAVGGIPSIVLDHVDQLDDKFPLLILLGRIECVLIFPSECRLAHLAVNISDSVQPREKYPLLSRTTTNVHY